MIQEISHYTYKTSDGKEFTSYKAAERYEQELELPAVYIVLGNIFSEKLVFSSEELAEEYIDTHYPSLTSGLRVVRCVIDYNSILNNKQK